MKMVSRSSSVAVAIALALASPGCRQSTTQSTDAPVESVPDKPVNARLIFDATDLAFAGATVVPLDAGIGFTEGMQAFLYTEPTTGVQFSFSTTNPLGFYTSAGFGTPAFVTFFPDGVSIAMDPPVAAIGFQFDFAECVGQGEFTGALGMESHMFGFGQSNLFLGASDIGDISSVVLNGGCFAAVWSEMRFVPSTGGGGPTDTANLVLQKDGPLGPVSQVDSPITYNMNVDNLGPDTANNTQVIDFLPRGTSVVSSNPAATIDATGAVTTQNLGDIPAALSDIASLSLDLPPFDLVGPLDVIEGPVGSFGCDSVLVNIALVTSSSIDPDTTNNLDVAVTHFDNDSRSGFPEICDNAFDDNCNGKVDCGENSCRFHPACRPPEIAFPPDWPDSVCDMLFPPPPGFTCIPPGDPRETPDNHTCSVPRGACGGKTLPASCCDPDRLSDTSPANLEYLREKCGLGIPGCVPIDPNFKESTPGVNAIGYGYTEAGRTHTYTLHYENVGTADAHDVSVIDVLSVDLDDTTLVVNDGGTFDPATRAIIWEDPVVPPSVPRSVSFSVAVRNDALPGTRIRNIGTIIFPDAVPPSRIDTNFVEHLIPDPAFPIQTNLSVFRCTETGQGTNEWKVDLVNEGWAYAFNVTATIVNPPASVQVTDGMASFRHRDDPNPTPLATVVPLAFTTSTDTVSFVTQTPGDPCGALTWLIQYEDLAGDVFSREVQASPDGDADAVPDDVDNCPATPNAGQADGDNDGLGDVCDPCPLDNPDDTDRDGSCDSDDGCPNDPNKTSPGTCGCGVSDADSDVDGVPDCDDNCPETPNPGQEDEDGNGVGDECETPPEGRPCDIDGDGDVDRCDLNVVLAGRGQTAAGPDDPRDVDGDGVITVLDARMCIVNCDVPRCRSCINP